MQNFFDPAILFFILGIVAGLLKSNLEIPAQVSRFLSLYLLMALGLKGGFALAASGLNMEVANGLLAAILLAIVVPAFSYPLLRRVLNSFDAAAIAATYGSVSAVTFITATQFMEKQGIPFGGHMAAAMALMESPAIIMAVLFANVARAQQGLSTGPHHGFAHVLKESFTEGAQILLLGAMLIGVLSGAEGKVAMQPFTGDMFKGMLAFFLLDMGLMTAKNLPTVRALPKVMLLYGLLAPFTHAGLAYALGMLMGLPAGDVALLMVLAASASYIAVPAVVRYAIPEANPSLYFGLSLGITFPLNILVGIPLYTSIAMAGF
ncbi:sodium-dependent bicarbonate transport family permease [Limnobacter sp.]|uniref:sodium-dependent bicarbonate transport family permease n=1 Tax=Limnobacter sp. TaxID=2003368 RepID=UPI003517E5C5